MPRPTSRKSDGCSSHWRKVSSVIAHGQTFRIRLSRASESTSITSIQIRSSWPLMTAPSVSPDGLSSSDSAVQRAIERSAGLHDGDGHAPQPEVQHPDATVHAEARSASSPARMPVQNRRPPAMPGVDGDLDRVDLCDRRRRSRNRARRARCPCSPSDRGTTRNARTIRVVDDPFAGRQPELGRCPEEPDIAAGPPVLVTEGIRHARAVDDVLH